MDGLTSGAYLAVLMIWPYVFSAITGVLYIVISLWMIHLIIVKL